MQKYKQLKDLNDSILELQKEKKNYILENYKNEIVITLNQLFFQNQDIHKKSKELNETVDDTKCLLRTMQRYLEDEKLGCLYKDFQKNYKLIDNLLGEQENLLNEYLTKMELYLK